ncbi:MAG TPA: efflux RND transporter periplasmic adaptor subunit [Acetobacteraceae bacterium]|nr:efflux RND transporter periplasmic adaptor subunit [Acetobacteraceae bacterium]
MRPRLTPLTALALLLVASVAAAPGARAAGPPKAPPPPAVGVVRAEEQPITQSNSFVGRIQATDRVSIVARVTAFLEQRKFVEGTEVKKGQLLYVLEQPPFQADVQAKTAAVAQANATLSNATITLNRARDLLHTVAGQRSTYDDALAAQQSDAALLLAAQANLRTSEINLGYTEIHSPIAGLIGRTAVTTGNVVTPSSGPLDTIVSQDPMYVVFPIPVRTALELRDRYARQGGMAAVIIKLELPNGKIYGETGKLDFINNTIAQSTDTILLRGVIPNPRLPGATPGQVGERELADGEFVNVDLQGVQQVEVLAIPRAAVLSGQQGDYVWVVGSGNKIEQRFIQLGQSTPSTAAVVSGLKPGEMVVSEGVQKVRPGLVVSPAPATPTPGLSATASPSGAAPAADPPGAAPAADPPGDSKPPAKAGGAASGGPGFGVTGAPLRASASAGAKQ